METMEATHAYYYGVIYKVASLTGMWPYLKPKSRIFRVTLLTVISLTLIIPEIAYQVRCKTDVQCTFQAMTAYLLSGISMLKIYTFQRNTRTIRELTRHLFADWKTLKTPEEYEIMRSYAENSRRFALIYLVYCSIAVITFVSMSVISYTLNIVRPLNQSRPLITPYCGYYFVDSEEYFFQILCHSLVAWQITVFAIIAHDSLFVTYVEHVCGMFALLGFHFERLFSKNDGTMKLADANRNQVNYKQVSFCILKHREILECAQLVEEIFTGPFAIQILIVTIGMSISLLQITQRSDDYLETIRYVLYVIGQLIHLFFLSFEGQKLIDHSFQICDRIYHSCWYSASVRSQKVIVMVIARSFRPAFLSAWKIYIFSLESFMTVLQTSMSYLTVLATV